METPHSYAAHLATYIASPLKIEKLVALEFDHVPPLHEIANMRLRVEREAKKFPSHWCKDKEDGDGIDFAPRSLVKAQPQPRKRDYINISPHTPALAPIPVVEIIDAVADAFGIAADAMRSKGKGRPLVLARAVAIRLIRDRLWENGEPKHSTPQIGRYLGNRDHSTVCHALEHFDDYKRRSPEVAEVYEMLRETLP